MSQPLVKIFTHPSPVLAVAVDPMGLQMVTAGLEGVCVCVCVCVYTHLSSLTTLSFHHPRSSACMGSAHLQAASLLLLCPPGHITRNITDGVAGGGLWPPRAGTA